MGINDAHHGSDRRPIRARSSSNNAGGGAPRLRRLRTHPCPLPAEPAWLTRARIVEAVVRSVSAPPVSEEVDTRESPIRCGLVLRVPPLCPARSSQPGSSAKTSLPPGSGPSLLAGTRCASLSIAPRVALL